MSAAITTQRAVKAARFGVPVACVRYDEKRRQYYVTRSGFYAAAKTWGAAVITVDSEMVTVEAPRGQQWSEGVFTLIEWRAGRTLRECYHWLAKRMSDGLVPCEHEGCDCPEGGAQ